MIWHAESEEFLLVRVSYVSCQEISEAKLDLVGVQGLRWKKGDIAKLGVMLFHGKGSENHQLGTEFLYTR